MPEFRVFTALIKKKLRNSLQMLKIIETDCCQSFPSDFFLEIDILAAMRTLCPIKTYFYTENNFFSQNISITELPDINCYSFCYCIYNIVPYIRLFFHVSMCDSKIIQRGASSLP